MFTIYAAAQEGSVTLSGCQLAVGWKQQPVIPDPLGLKPFVRCLLVNLPLFYLYKRSFLPLDI
jgi:hypothetical protein